MRSRSGKLFMPEREIFSQIGKKVLDISREAGIIIPVPRAGIEG